MEQLFIGPRNSEFSKNLDFLRRFSLQADAESVLLPYDFKVDGSLLEYLIHVATPPADALRVEWEEILRANVDSEMWEFYRTYLQHYRITVASSPSKNKKAKKAKKQQQMKSSHDLVEQLLGRMPADYSQNEDAKAAFSVPDDADPWHRAQAAFIRAFYETTMTPKYWYEIRRHLEDYFLERIAEHPELPEFTMWILTHLFLEPDVGWRIRSPDVAMRRQLPGFLGVARWAYTMEIHCCLFAPFFLGPETLDEDDVPALPFRIVSPLLLDHDMVRCIGHDILCLFQKDNWTVKVEQAHPDCIRNVYMDPQDLFVRLDGHEDEEEQPQSVVGKEYNYEK